MVQDVFLRVVERRRELSGIVEIRPWLVRIVWNLALDRRRKVRPEQMDDLFVEGLVSGLLPADQALAESSQIRRVLDAIERLPRHERQALLLSAMEELSTEEIAEVVGKRVTQRCVRSCFVREPTCANDWKIEHQASRRSNGIRTR